MFPYLPHQPGYNKRLRAALPLMKQTIRDLAADSDFWFDNVWVADSTPVECGRSRPAARRSDLAGWANYGYCASHSRWFWGLRLYLICTPAGMPILWALADPKIGEREVLTAMVDVEPQLATSRPGLILITDKGFAGRVTEADLASRGTALLRPARKDEAARHGEPLLKSVRQLIDQSTNQRSARPRSTRRMDLEGVTSGAAIWDGAIWTTTRPGAGRWMRRRFSRMQSARRAAAAGSGRCARRAAPTSAAGRARRRAAARHACRPLAGVTAQPRQGGRGVLVEQRPQRVPALADPVPQPGRRGGRPQVRAGEQDAGADRREQRVEQLAPPPGWPRRLLARSRPARS